MAINIQKKVDDEPTPAPTTTPVKPKPKPKPKPKDITKTVVEGFVEKTSKTGGASTEKIVVTEVVSDAPMANVGISIAMTKNLGNYESLKVQVSIHMPTKTDLASLDDAFLFCQTWADNKMAEVLKDE